jgi:hypothetical protein
MSATTLNVVCVKWGTKYPSEYVNNMAKAMRRHLTIPHRFVCLTDDPSGIDEKVETKPFTDDLPGWWNKVALFQPRIHDLEGTLLYLDLDMVVIRNIDVLASHPGDFLAIPTARAEGEFASTLMRFPIGRYPRVWELFIPRARQVMSEIYGDQNWINACCSATSGHEYTQKVRDLWPEVSPPGFLIEPISRSWFPHYKAELQGGPELVSAAAKVIVFHGKPMIHEVEWVARLWRGEVEVPNAHEGDERSPRLGAEP